MYGIAVNGCISPLSDSALCLLSIFIQCDLDCELFYILVCRNKLIHLLNLYTPLYNFPL